MPLPVLRRNAQLQMTESIIVVILILVLAAFALIFTAGQAKQKYQIMTDTYQELDAVETAQVVTSLYELRCAKEGMESTCVDLYKAQALQETIKADSAAALYYYDLLRNAKITLEQVYPPLNDPEMVIYESNATEGTQGARSVMIPVSIYDAAKDTLAFGTLTVQRFHGGSTK